MKIILIISLAFLLQASPSCSEKLFGPKTTVKSSSFNPYQDSLETLLPKDISLGSIKFKQETIRKLSFKGATEAIESNYIMEANGIGVAVQFKVANFPSEQVAESAIKTAALEKTAALQTKKTGHRFTDQDGRAIVWTNGSLLCIAYSQFAKTTSNFEEAMPF